MTDEKDMPLDWGQFVAIRDSYERDIERLEKEGLALDDAFKLEKVNHAIEIENHAIEKTNHEITAACLKDEIERFNTQSREIEELKGLLAAQTTCAETWYQEFLGLKESHKTKPKKICPLFYGRPFGSNHCKREGCMMWTATKTSGYCEIRNGLQNLQYIGGTE